MKRYWLASSLGLSFLLSQSTCQVASAQWQQQAQQRAAQEQQRQQQGLQQAQQAQQRAQEQMQQRAQQQQQAQQAQMQQRAQQQQQAQQAQMQQRAQQQQQAQQAQMQQRAQEQQQRQQVQLQQRAQEQQQRQQVQLQQRAQEQQQRQQAQQQRNYKEQQMRQQAQAQRAQEHQRAQQQVLQRVQEQTGQDKKVIQQAQQRQLEMNQREQQRQAQQWGQTNQKAFRAGRGIERIESPIKPSTWDKNKRLMKLPPLKVKPVPLHTAFPIPNFAANASPDQLNRARIAQENMQKHLWAVPRTQVPPNFARFRDKQIKTYYNNYPFWMNNQRYYINRQNTSYYPVSPNYYPSWYQPNPNWVYSNGFSLANAVQIGMNWLGFGWQPYYGAPPTGFICARDYMPTPWIYEVATGQWKQPGLYSYISEGPGYDYTGPITVEVIEQVIAPTGQVVNVLCLYDAFYYPEMGRWGYQDRQGYFIWVDA
jgi:hypothetical protein